MSVQWMRSMPSLLAVNTHNASGPKMTQERELILGPLGPWGIEILLFISRLRQRETRLSFDDTKSRKQNCKPLISCGLVAVVELMVCSCRCFLVAVAWYLTIWRAPNQAWRSPNPCFWSTEAKTYRGQDVPLMVQKLNIQWMLWVSETSACRLCMLPKCRWRRNINISSTQSLRVLT